MTSRQPPTPVDRAEQEAFEWLGRLRAPGGEAHQAAFESWFVGDPRHADAYERILESWDRFDIVAKTPVGKARRPFFAATPHAMKRRHMALAAIAAVLVIVMIGTGARYFGFASGPLVSAAYASDIGQIRTATLADGSRIILDTDTALRTTFTGKERRVQLLRGRARFVVVGDVGRPFVVAAADRTLVAVGTIFDVDISGREPSVSVIAGRVRIDPAARAPRVTATLVRPGQTMSLRPTVAPDQAGGMPKSDLRWTSGMVSFEDARLDDVVARANRYARGKIVLIDEAARAKRFTGTFRPTDTDALARMLARTFDFIETRDSAGDYRLGTRRAATASR